MDMANPWHQISGDLAATLVPARLNVFPFWLVKRIAIPNHLVSNQESDNFGVGQYCKCSWCGSGADAFFEDRGVSYTCIAGCAVRGNGRAPRRSLPRYSFSAYSQVCGAGHLVEGAPPRPPSRAHMCVPGTTYRGSSQDQP